MARRLGPEPVCRLVGTGEDGPIYAVESYACDRCGATANVPPARSGSRTVVHSEGLDNTISRRIDETVYACSAHYDEISAALVDRYGYASNIPLERD